VKAESGTGALVAGLFAELERRAIRYCVLRNYELLPDHKGRDIDILISRRDKRRVACLIQALCSQCGFQVYKHRADERFFQFLLCRRTDDLALEEVQIDFLTDTQVYGVRLVPGEEILNARVRYRTFYVASDVHRFLDKWLFNHLLGAPLEEKYHEEFRAVAAMNRERIQSVLDRLLGPIESERLVNSICARGFGAVARVRRSTLLRHLLGVAARAPWYHGSHVAKFVYYRLKDRLAPSGEFVAVSGPDGCGKSTVLAQATMQLERLFRARPEYHGHFRPGLLPRIAKAAQKAGLSNEIDENYSSPHRAEPAGLMGSLFRFTYYLTDFLIGYALRIRPILARGELVIYDRYFFDMVADPGRSRISLPGWIRRLALALVPLPHTAFFVHVHSEVVRQRKQELSDEKIDELNASYMRMVASGHLQLLDNGSTVERAAAQLVDAVIARRRGRLKLDKRFPAQSATMSARR
jgi:thymidylate kinase